MTYLETASRACAVCVLLLASVPLAGCVSTVSGTAVAPENAAPLAVPLLDEAKLDDVLLSIREINDIMGATRMRVSGELDDMTDHSAEVSDPDCLGAVYAAQAPVYAGSHWTTVRDQVAREPGNDNDHWVEQTVVLYETAEDAQKFFDESKATWQRCAGNSVATDGGDTTFLWQVEDVEAEDMLITQLTPQHDAGGWACQHALSVVSNLTAEAWACSFDITDEAATIASDMIENATRE